MQVFISYILNYTFPVLPFPDQSHNCVNTHVWSYWAFVLIIALRKVKYEGLKEGREVKIMTRNNFITPSLAIIH